MLENLRRPASKLSFPALLGAVNAKLTSGLNFEREFLSMQKVRNCLEHRVGIVRKQDLDADGEVLTLSFPRMMFFYMRGSEEIELAQDERVDARDGEATVQILGRIVTRSRTYHLGERITFAAGEFSEIAMACSFFGNELASKLPVGQSSPIAPAQT